jgi:hypothetical protein
VFDDSPAKGTNYIGAVSSNTAVIANTNIAIRLDPSDKTGLSYLVAVTPNPYCYGTNIPVTLLVTNLDNQVVTATFLVTVTKAVYPPTLTLGSSIVNVNPLQSATNTISYTNIHVSNLSDLLVSVSTSDEGVLPTNRIVVTSSNIVVLPVAVTNSSCTVTVTVTQSTNVTSTPQSVSKTFAVNVVQGSVPLFASTSQIVINDDLPATPFPSAVAVSGVSGNITNVRVTLLGFQHTYPNDVAMLLVGPQKQAVILMRGAGRSDTPRVSGLQISFDDHATNVIPGSSPLTSGTFTTADYKPTSSFYSNITSGLTIGTNLSVFNGTQANGNWVLYVEDDVTNDSGVISNGWALSITTDGPMITTTNAFANVVVPENTTNYVAFTVGSASTDVTNLTSTASVVSSSLSGLFASSALPVSVSPTNSSVRIITIAPQLNMPSLASTSNATAVIQIVVTDTNSPSKTAITNQFPVTVSYVDQLPVISGLVASSTTAANVAVSNAFSVSDVDSSLSLITTVASTTNTDLGTASVVGIGSTRQLVFSPVGKTGTAYITIVVSDGTASTQYNASVSLTNSLQTTVSAPSFVATPANVTTNFTFSVTPGVSSMPVVVSAWLVDSSFGSISTAQKDASTWSVSFSPATSPTKTGTTYIALVVSNAYVTVTSNVTVNVSAAIQPVFSTLSPITTPANVITNETFTVQPGIPGTAVAVTASGWDMSLGAVNVNQSGTNFQLVFTPNSTLATGSTTITLVASNSYGYATGYVNLTVTAAQVATVAGLPTQLSIHANESTTNLQFTVTPGIAGSSVSVGAVVADSSFGSVGTVYNGANGWTLSFTPDSSAARVGTNTITVYVTNASVVVTKTISLQVLPALQPVFNGLSSISTPGNLTSNLSFTVAPGVPGTQVAVVMGVFDTSVGIVNLTGSGTNWTLSFAPNIASVGKSSSVVLMASNASVWVQTNITVSVSALAQPTFTGLGAISTPANGTVTNAFTVTPAVPGTIVSVLPPTIADSSFGSVSVQGSGTAWKLVFVPNLVTGSTTVSVVASNANAFTTNNINVTVTAAAGPTFAGLSVISTPANVPVTNSFVVAPGVPNASVITLTAQVADTNIGNVVVNLNGTNATLIFTPRLVVGSTVITLVASNAGAVTTYSNAVTVVNPLQPAIINLSTNISTPGNIAVTNQFVVTPGIAGTVVSASASLASTNFGTVSVTGTGTNWTLVYTPKVLGGTSNTVIYVVASNVFAYTTNQIPVTVLPGVPPTITSASAISTPANVSSTNVVTASSVTVGASISLAASIDDTNMGTVKVVGFATNSWNLVFTPKGITGTANVSLVANDGKVSATNQVVVTVTAGLAPVLTTIPMQTVQENTAIHVAFSVTNSVSTVPTKITYSFDNSNLIASVSVAGSGPYMVNVNLMPYATSNKYGLGTVTLTASNVFGVSTSSFKVNATWVYTPPTFSAMYDFAVKANSKVIVPLTVVDPDWDITALSYTASFSNPTLVSGYSMLSSNGIMNLVVNLATNQIGVSAITVFVGDGTSTVAQGCTMTVLAPAAPTLAAIASVTNIANKVAGAVLSFPLNITSVETPLTNLTVSAIASNTDLVSGAVTTVTSSNATLVVSVRTAKVGTSAVTVTVNDGINAAAVQQFNVVVQAPAAPVVTVASNTVAKVGVPVLVPITVSSPDTLFSNMSFIISLSDHTYVSSAFLNNTGSNLVATVTPTTNVGVASIVLVANDGFTNVLATFNVSVVAPTAPTLVASNVTVKANVSSVTNPVTVIAGDIAATNLSYRITTTNRALVSGVTLGNVGLSNMYAVVTLVSNQTGVATINVRANDGYTEVLTPFVVTVNAAVGPTLSAKVVGGVISITFVGDANTVYTVQSTSNFSSWSDVVSVTTDGNGAGSYSTSASTGFVFYRVVVK